MTIEESVIYLASCAVNGEIPNKDKVSGIDQTEALSFAEKHMIGCCVAMALESAGIKSADTSAIIGRAMRRSALYEASLQEVTERLREEGIAYTPLKGIVLKQYYPLPFMREMSDHDILIDASRSEDVQKVMEGLGFTAKRIGIWAHDIYFKPPVLNYEMHRSLFSTRTPQLNEYYKGMKDLSKPEDQYLYLVAHEFKHYSTGGTGLRSLLDAYLFLKKETLDWEYVEEEAGKLGIREFEKDNRRLAASLFQSGAVTDEKMLSYILNSSAYGNFEHRVDNKLKSRGGNRVLYTLKRVSIPVLRSDHRYKAFAAKYPLFYRNKILLPLLPLYRVFRSVKTGLFAKEWKLMWKK